jgi:hypothetical protein
MPRRLDSVVVAVFAAASAHLMFEPGFPIGHDTPHHLWGIYALSKAIRDGDLYPRWVHHIGLGMPLLQFYPPGSLLPLVPLLALDIAPFRLLKVALVAYPVLSGLAMYQVALRWTSDRRAAAATALAYVWAPYVLLDRHYRAALAESAAFVIFPPFFYFVIAAVRGSKRRWIRAAAVLSTAALFVVHPISTIVASVGVLIWIVAEAAWVQTSWHQMTAHIARFGAIAVLGWALAGFYTLPLVVEARHTSLSKGVARVEGTPLYGTYGITVAEALRPQRWDRLKHSERTGTWAERSGRGMPYYVGITLFCLMPAALMAAPRTDRRNALSDPRSPDTFTAPAFVLLALSGIVLSLKPLDAILGAIPFFAAIQFPWRFLSLASFGLAAAAGFATLHLTRLAAKRHVRTGSLIPALIGSLLIFDGFPYSGAADWAPAYEGVAYLSDPKGLCSKRLDCWESRTVTGPFPLRAEGLRLLPPTNDSIDLSRFGFVYPELYTPAVWRNFYAPSLDSWSEEVLREAGIHWTFSLPGKKPFEIDAMPYAEWISDEDGRRLSLGYSRRAARIHAEAPPGPGRVIVREQWFPGWMLRDASGQEREVERTSKGLMEVRVGSDHGTIHLYFSDYRWDRIGGWLLSLVTMVVVLAGSLTGSRQRALR